MLDFLFNKNVSLPNSLSIQSLNGEVKEIITRFEGNKIGFGDFDPYHALYFNDLYFDTSGNLREEITYSSFDQVEQINKYFYDLNNQLVSKIVTGFVKFMTNYVYKYRRNKIIVTSYSGEKNSEKNDFRRIILMKKGKIISITTAGTFPKYKIYQEYKNDKLVKVDDGFFKTTYDYDGYGNKKVEKKFGLSGKIFKIITYEYNSKNVLISHTATNSSGEIKEKCKYSTDSKGNWIKKEILNIENLDIFVVTRNIKYYHIKDKLKWENPLS